MSQVDLAVTGNRFSALQCLQSAIRHLLEGHKGGKYRTDSGDSWAVTKLERAQLALLEESMNEQYRCGLQSGILQQGGGVLHA